MNASNSPAPAIGRDDLARVTETVLMRLPLRAAESRRLAEMGALLAAEAALVNSLSEHLHCVRVNFSGTHGSGSLPAATNELCSSLDAFADQVRRIAADYAWLTPQPDEEDGGGESNTATGPGAPTGAAAVGAGAGAAGGRPRLLA